MKNNLEADLRVDSGVMKQVMKKEPPVIDTNAFLRKNITSNSIECHDLSYHEYCSLKEPIQHGSEGFPLRVYEISSYTWLKERIWCHWHDEIEFVLVTNGEADFQIDDVSYHMKEKDILMIPPNRLHFATQETGKAFDFIAVVFSVDFISPTHEDVIYQKYVAPFLNQQIIFQGAAGHEIEEILYKIKKYYVKKPFGYELEIKTELYQLWSKLVRYVGNANENAEKVPLKSSTKAKQIKEVISYLKKHYTEIVSSKDISEQFHLSEGYLCRMFKDITGKTLTDYLNYYRVTMSTYLLLEADMEISQIALSVGFNNASYYNKMFRKYMNKTPGEFRKSRR